MKQKNFKNIYMYVFMYVCEGGGGGVFIWYCFSCDYISILNIFFFQVHGV